MPKKNENTWLEELADSARAEGVWSSVLNILTFEDEPPEDASEVELLNQVADSLTELADEAIEYLSQVMTRRERVRAMRERKG